MITQHSHYIQYYTPQHVMLAHISNNITKLHVLIHDIAKMSMKCIMVCS